MTAQPWTQTFPNPGLDPGFRVDPRGHARFLVQGYGVDVVVAYLSDGSDEVEVTASVTMHGIRLAESLTRGEWGEPYVLRDLLGMVLTDVVREARSAVHKLAQQVAETDAKNA